MKPEDVLQNWNESAFYWDKHREVVRTMFAPISQALFEEARIRPGYSVLDVGTGPGEPALSAVELVGPAGSVCGVDPIQPMIESATREAQRRGLSNVGFEVASTENLRFATNSFDAIISRFAVMFFTDPLSGVREVLRVLKPDCRMAFAVWHAAEANPFHFVLTETLSRYIESPPPKPDAPGAFRFAEHGKLGRLLTEAGATDVRESMHRFSIQARISPEQFWQIRTELSDTLRAKIAMLTPDQLAAAKRDVLEDAQKFFSKDGMSIPAEVLIVSGRKAGGP